MKHLKKLLVIVLAMTLLPVLPVFATGENYVDVVLDGEKMEFDVRPQIVDDRTLVPMRAIFEAFGALVEWEEETQTVTATKGDTVITLTINDNIAYIGSEKIELDVAAMIIDSRTMVPLRFIAETLDAGVEWNDVSRTVIITSPAPEPVWPYWDQDIIDKAVSTSDVSFALDSNYRWRNSLESSQAMYLMALAVNIDPTIQTSSRKLVLNRLLEQIDNMLTGGSEPSCMGGLGGWIDNAAAQTLVLAKNTPEVWSRLTDEQKEKADFIMKAMAVAGNYTHNYKAAPKTDMSQITWWENGWNPNHVEGYVGIMIAANIYFGGAKEVNKIFADFSYDEYTSKMNEYGYVNMLKLYESTGKELLEKGGVDALGGSVVGAKLPFTYKDIMTGDEIKYDPLDLYVSLATRMYYHPVVSKVYDNSGELKGYIADGTESPFEGQTGMGYEFVAMDANGIRTSADYFVTGWRNSVITRATLERLGLFEGKDAEKVAEIMYVGSEDFLYKVSPERGYRGWSKGQDLGVQSEANSFKGVGYDFFKQIWQKVLKGEN